MTKVSILTAMVKSVYSLRVSTAVASNFSPSVTRGHKKKARTRQALLDAATELLSERGEVFGVAEVVQTAGVSHGTFYNYFLSREELIEALAPHVAERLAAKLALEVDDPDPAMRFACISARALTVALREPATIRVAVRLDRVRRELLMRGPLAHLARDLRAGHRAGRFIQPMDDGTIDVVLGSLLLAARRIADGQVDVAYRRSVLRRLLMALGMPSTEAQQFAAHATKIAGESLQPR
jgi:AcrR family transcriptional regulator